MIEWHIVIQVSGPFLCAWTKIYQIQYCPDIMTGHIVKVSESTVKGIRIPANPLEFLGWVRVHYVYSLHPILCSGSYHNYCPHALQRACSYFKFLLRKHCVQIEWHINLHLGKKKLIYNYRGSG